MIAVDDTSTRVGVRRENTGEQMMRGGKREERLQASKQHGGNGYFDDTAAEGIKEAPMPAIFNNL